MKPVGEGAKRVIVGRVVISGSPEQRRNVIPTGLCPYRGGPAQAIRPPCPPFTVLITSLYAQHDDPL
jgi:hypothetical protein